MKASTLKLSRKLLLDDRKLWPIITVEEMLELQEKIGQLKAGERSIKIKIEEGEFV